MAARTRSPSSTRLLDTAASLGEVREKLNTLYYGDGGTGKTTNLAFMANLGKTLLITAEGGIKRAPLKRRGVEVDNIKLIPDPSKYSRVSYQMLEDLFWELKEDLDADPNSWAGTGWDSITEIHKVLLDDVVTISVEKDMAKFEKGQRAEPRDEFFIDRGDYGTMTEQMRKLVRRYRDLPCHFGMTALTRTDREGDGAVVINPNVTPALRGDVIGYVDMVCYTDVQIVGGDEIYRGLFRPAGRFRGKDRFDVLPRRLVNPWFNRLLEYAEGELDSASDPIQRAAMERIKAAKSNKAGGGSEEDDSATQED